MYITAIYNFLAIMMKEAGNKMKFSKSTRGRIFRIHIKKTFKGVAKIAKTINQVLQCFQHLGH